MPDENGDLFPGELGGGSYGAIEADLGEKLRPLAGFGRDLEPPVEPQEGDADAHDSFWDEEEEDQQVSPGGFSTGLPARYTMRGFDA